MQSSMISPDKLLEHFGNLYRSLIGQLSTSVLKDNEAMDNLIQNAGGTGRVADSPATGTPTIRSSLAALRSQRPLFWTDGILRGA